MRQYQYQHQHGYRQTFAKWLLLLSVAIALSACGFHLRGKPNLPFKSIYLDVATTSPLGLQLKRYLKASGIVVTDNKKDAEAIFQLLADTQEKKILTLSTVGQVSEYVLYKRTTFTVVDAKGKVLVPPSEIVLKRDISYNTQQELSKQAEEVILYNDMQADLVQQILRRMSAITLAPAVPVDGADGSE
ncbi:MAG TPA: LPS assembly lipoprotein LptE [Herbaspirillum sp.]|jgi:LPS-assembly lipoprotein